MNLFGKDLLELCKAYMLRIANRQVNGDKDVGHFTYICHNGCSVIDYLILSCSIWHRLCYFKVDDRSESSHMPIVCKLICGCTLNRVQNNTDSTEASTKIRYVFNEDSTEEFRTNLSRLLSQEFVHHC